MAEPEQSDSFVIVGQTADGKRFRPSDWAERLCGVMSQYGPAGRRSGHLTYSPYVMPGNKDGIKRVTVDARLYVLEPLAYRFMLSFARDNNLLMEPADDNPGPAGTPNPSPAPLAADC